MSEEGIHVVESFVPTCGVCGQAIHERFFACPSCGVVHHQDCWDFNGGCAAFGCGQTRTAPPASSLPTVASSPMTSSEGSSLTFLDPGKRRWAWGGIVTGLAGLAATMSLTPLLLLHPLGIFSAGFLAAGIRLLGQRLEVRPGGIRIGSALGTREYTSDEVRVTRVAWMNTLIFHDAQGTQLLTLRMAPADLERVVGVLGSLAGLTVD